MTKQQSPQTLKNLLKGVRSNDSQSKGMLYLYLRETCFPKIERYLLNRGANREDAADFFQDAILILLDAIQREKFKLMPMWSPSKRTAV